MSKRETNVEFVTRLMEFSPFGALSQMMVIEAIGRYAAQVAEAPPMEHGLIDGEAWKELGKYITEEIEAHYGR